MGLITPITAVDNPLEPELKRALRQLERQRQARLEAERIAERGLRELYLRQQRSSLLHEIATLANHTSSSRVAYALALERICDHTGWARGNVYLRDGDAGLKSAGICQTSDAMFDSFFEASVRYTFSAGVGLPGRVLETGEPCWITHLQDDGSFLRRDAATAIGLVSALAVPVLVGSKVDAVLEFFSCTKLLPDEELLDVLTQIGVQLGRVVERERLTHKLTQDALYDGLTMLPKTLLWRRLDDALTRRAQDPSLGVTILFMDLDGFKLVNDSAGTPGGRQAAGRRRARARPDLARLYRPGGVPARLHACPLRRRRIHHLADRGRSEVVLAKHRRRAAARAGSQSPVGERHRLFRQREHRHRPCRHARNRLTRCHPQCRHRDVRR